MIAQDCRITEIYVRINAAPDINGGLLYTVRRNGVQSTNIGDTALTANILFPNTITFSAGNEPFVVGDLLSVRVTRAGPNWGGGSTG